MNSRPANITGVPLMRDGTRWLTVAAFAVAMAWVEAAVVFYLRKMIDRIDPYQPYPFPEFMGISQVELVREAATLVMLLTVGLLAGRDSRSRWGYAAIAFGFWDIFYYVFLRIICGWPKGLNNWDVLFLIPLPWWGPVVAPMLIAVLMIVWGTLATQGDHEGRQFRSEWRAWLVNFAGIGLALYVFMADALSVLDQGPDAVREMLPEKFGWPLFCVALLLMSAPILDFARRNWRRKPSPPTPDLNQGVTG